MPSDYFSFEVPVWNLKDVWLKIDLKAHTVEAVKSQIATSQNFIFHSDQEGGRRKKEDKSW